MNLQVGDEDPRDNALQQFEAERAISPLEPDKKMACGITMENPSTLNLF